MALRVVFFGTPQFAVPSLERLLQDERFTVLGVVTQPDKRRGRGSQLSPSPVKTLALSQGLPVWQPARIRRDAETLTQLAALQADVFGVVAYGQILSQEILDLPRWGCVNGHGSLLPQYRGAAPIQWCLYHGDRQTGVTTMLMDKGMDTGAMLLKQGIAIGPTDNAVAIAEQLAAQTADLLATTLPLLAEGRLAPQPQDEQAATYAPLIQKSDYGLDWSRPALALHNQVRGFYPSCTSPFRGQLLKIQATLPLAADLPWPPELQPILSLWQAQERENPAPAIASSSSSAGPSSASQPTPPQPGEVMALLKNHGPVIQTGDGPLLLRQVQPAGKKPQSGWDFVNGLRVELGESLR